MKKPIKIDKNGQWSVDSDGSKESLKVKIADKADPSITKLKALGAKLEAIKQLKAKKPNIDWEEKFKQSLEEINTLVKEMYGPKRSDLLRAQQAKEKLAEKEKIKQNKKLDRQTQKNIDLFDRREKRARATRIERKLKESRERQIAENIKNDKLNAIKETERRAAKPRAEEMGPSKRHIPDEHLPKVNETEAAHRARLQSHFNANPRPGITQQHHNAAIRAAWEAGPKTFVKTLTNGQWELLEKGFTSNTKVPKGACDCGAHAVNSNMHSDWCSGLKAADPHQALALKHPKIHGFLNDLSARSEEIFGKKADAGNHWLCPAEETPFEDKPDTIYIHSYHGDTSDPDHPGHDSKPEQSFQDWSSHINEHEDAIHNFMDKQGYEPTGDVEDERSGGPHHITRGFRKKKP